MSAPHTVRSGPAQIDDGSRRVTTDESAELKRLKAGKRRLTRANAMRTAASAFFAAELDRPGHRSRRQPNQSWQTSSRNGGQ